MKLTNKDFVHCHVHSSFSTFDGLSPVKDLVVKARNMEFPALALTDHGVSAGLIQFMQHCQNPDLTYEINKEKKQAGPPIKPICGVEFYFCKDHKAKNKEEQPEGKKGNYHLTVLAKNWQGYRNLCALNDIAWKEGYYYSPRIDLDLLLQYKEGLIVTSGCPSSLVSNNLAFGRYNQGKRLCEILKDSFGEDFYIEVMYHGIDFEKNIIPDQFKIAKELNVPIIGSNDSHYLNKEDHDTHEVFLSMSTRTCIKNPNRIRFAHSEFHLKSAEEMMKVWKFAPEVVYNTVKLAETVDYEDIKYNLFGGMKLPKFNIPNYITEKVEKKDSSGFYESFQYLKDLAIKGMKDLGWDQSKKHMDALKRELIDVKVAYESNGYNFATYFLIVWDILKWCRDNNIYISPGRGSGYASVLLRALKICYGPDPIDNKLIWERFLGFDTKIFIKEQDFNIDLNNDINASTSYEEIIKNIVDFLKTKNYTDQEKNRLKQELKVFKETEGLNNKNNLEVLYKIWKQKNNTGDKNEINSLLAYYLDITNFKPALNDPLLKRRCFARAGFPDIDIDIEDERRDEVIQFLRNRFGKDNVANIGTYGTLKLRSVITRAVKALDIANAWNKGNKEYVSENAAKATEILDTLPKASIIKVWDNDGMRVIDTIQEAYEEFSNFRYYLDKYPELKKHAQKMEGLLSSYSTHAGGVVLGQENLKWIAPTRDKNINIVDEEGKKKKVKLYATQYTMEDCESVGLIKFDFLGVAIWSVIKHAIEMIKDNYGIELDLNNISIKDKKTLELYKSGLLKGVFQCEEYGMQQTFKKLSPDKFQDIPLVISMYRPGPMDNIQEYCDRREGYKDANYFHPSIEKHAKPILEENHGFAIYQEEIMRLFNNLSGLSLTEAYVIIKAIGKKKPELLAKYEKKFIEGCYKNNIPKNIAQNYWQRFIVPFSGYGFNKCFSKDSTLIDSKTGNKITIEKVFHKVKNGEKVFVNSIDKNGKLVRRPVTDVYYNGKKKVYKLTTRSGYSLKITKNHKIKTPRGMIPLKDINVGEYVATPKYLFANKYNKKMNDYKIITLAHLISEGNTCHPTTLYFYNNDQKMIDDFINNAKNFKNTEVNLYTRKYGVKKEVRLNKGKVKQIAWNKGLTLNDYQNHKSTRGQDLCGAYNWAKKLNIINKKANEKFIPDIIFNLSNKKIGLFLGRLWSGDGFAFSDKSSKKTSPYYSTSSYQLAIDIKILLLKLGICSNLSMKKFKYKDSYKIGYILSIYDKESLMNFINYISPNMVGREEYVKLLKNSVSGKPSQRDVIPLYFKETILEEIEENQNSIEEICKKSSVSTQTLRYPSSYLKNDLKENKHSYYRDTIRKINSILKSDKVSKIVDSDIMWDRIVKIEEDEECDTYDLTVDIDHNLVIDGIVSSNSHAFAYGYTSWISAYLKANYTEEFFCATLNSLNRRKDFDKMDEIIKDLKNFDVLMMEKDINKSKLNYKIVKKKNLKEGIKKSIISPSLMCKGVGLKSAYDIEKNQPYSDLKDMILKVDSKCLNIKTLTALYEEKFLDKILPKSIKNEEDLNEYYNSIKNDLKKIQKKGINPTEGIF